MGTVCEIHAAPTRNGGEFPLSRRFRALIGSTTSEWDDMACTPPKTGQTGSKSTRMAQAGAVFAQNGANRLEVGQNGPNGGGFLGNGEIEALFRGRRNV